MFPHWNIIYSKKALDELEERQRIGKSIDDRVVCILSGGMDSTTLLWDLYKQNKNPYAISFDYGQRHRKELDMAKRTCELLHIPRKLLSVSSLNEVAPSSLTRSNWKMPHGHYEADNMKQTVVPNRNMVMLSLATAYAIGIGAKEIYYGAHSGDHAIYPDCRPEFVNAMKQAIKICDFEPLSLEAPYLLIAKSDILKRGLDLGVRYDLTWSCYEGGKEPCGKCGTCVERTESFVKNHRMDPLYKINSHWDDAIDFMKQTLEARK